MNDPIVNLRFDVHSNLQFQTAMDIAKDTWHDVPREGAAVAVPPPGIDISYALNPSDRILVSSPTIILDKNCTAPYLRRDVILMIEQSAYLVGRSVVLSECTLLGEVPEGYPAHLYDGRTFDFLWYAQIAPGLAAIRATRAPMIVDGKVSMQFDAEANAIFLLGLLDQHSPWEIQIPSKLRDAVVAWVRRQRGDSRADFLWMALSPEDSGVHDWHGHCRAKRDKNE